MMSRHFRLSSELTGAIAKRLPHAKNHLSAPGSFFNQFVTEIYPYYLKSINVCLFVSVYIHIYSLACAARLADTKCPPEAPFGCLGSHWLFIREITSLNTSVQLLLV